VSSPIGPTSILVSLYVETLKLAAVPIVWFVRTVALGWTLLACSAECSAENCELLRPPCYAER
jgi:hypothetical protein